jgi:hypothetical protein
MANPAVRGVECRCLLNDKPVYTFDNLKWAREDTLYVRVRAACVRLGCV